MRGAQIDKILSGEDTWQFSGPGERSREIETGNFQEIGVRTCWDRSRGLKPPNLGQKSGFAGFPGLNSNLIVVNPDFV